MNLHIQHTKDLVPNVRVPHPISRLRMPDRHWLVELNDRVLDWVSVHVLASIVMFDVALILPLVAIPMADSVKITLGVISGSWFQWWALPALQRSQVKTDLKREAKAETDHIALTHIANTVDAILAKLEKPAAT
jgi:predicted ABC-type exoprotein transport system permease subunit